MGLTSVIERLRSILSRLDDVELSVTGLLKAAQAIVDLVHEAYQLISGDFKPESDDIDDAAAAWKSIASHAGQAQTDLSDVPQKITTTAWSGEDGSALRSSVGTLSTKVGTAENAATEVYDALVQLGADMKDARDKRDEAEKDLGGYLSISWDDLNPFNVINMLRDKISGAKQAIDKAIDAYQDAVDAVEKADREIVRAMDGITLPTHLPDGVSAVDVVGAWSDDEGPLRGNTLANFEEWYDQLSPAEQAEVDRALGNASSQEEKGLIMAAVAAGMSGDELDNYVKQLASMDDSDLSDLDPTTFTGDFAIQPDDTTCGSSTLVMARMMNDPAYAMYMRLGYDPETGQHDGLTMEERFRQESLDMHERTNGLNQSGGPGVPWPKGLGTSPGGLTNEMNNGNAGMPGTTYDMKYTDPGDRGDLYNDVLAASNDGHAVPLFVGNDYSPRHILLVIGNDGDDLTVYNPADGETHTITRSEWEGSNLGNKASWDEPWGAVVPR